MAKPTSAARPVPTYDHLRARQQRAESLFLIDDTDLRDEYQRAQTVLNVASIGTDADEIKQARTAVHEVEAKLRTSPDVVELKFRGISDGRLKRIMRLKECLPTPEQVEQADSNGDGQPLYNPDEFLPRVVAATLIEPRLTVEQVKALFGDDDALDDADLISAPPGDGWNRGEAEKIRQTALAVCQDATALVALPN
jgi:hypothetical protein